MIEQKECATCEEGYACPPGKVKIGCNEGEFAPEGKAECSNCDLGTFNPTPNQGTCTSCLRGKFQDARGQTSCVPCPINTYSEERGNTAAAQCLKCDIDYKLNTVTLKDGQSSKYACICKGKNRNNEGYYQNPMGGTTKNDFCIDCPKGAICANANTTVEKLESQFSYWRFDSNENTFIDA